MDVFTALKADLIEKNQASGGPKWH